MPKARLLDVVRDRIRVKHYSYRTETSYLGWIRRFIRFHGGRHPREMGGPEAEQFLSYLATERSVAASTQNQALSAILFLYRETLEIEGRQGSLHDAAGLCARTAAAPPRAGARTVRL